MTPTKIKFENETELNAILDRINTGLFFVEIEDFTDVKGQLFTMVGRMRFDAGKRMRKHDVFFKFNGIGGGVFKIECSNNKLIDTNAQSKRTRLVEAFNNLKDGESVKFKTSEIDPAYCRSIISKLGVPYTTKVEYDEIHIIKTTKRLSNSAILKEKINELENKGVIEFTGEVSYLRQIASNMRTPEFRYSIKQIGVYQYEITRLFYEDLKPNRKPASIYDVITPDYVDFYLEDNEIAFLSSIVKKLQSKINDAHSVAAEILNETITPEPINKDLESDELIFVDYSQATTPAVIPSNKYDTNIYSEDIDENDPKLRDIDGMLAKFKMPDLGPDVEDGLL